MRKLWKIKVRAFTILWTILLKPLNGSRMILRTLMALFYLLLLSCLCELKHFFASNLMLVFLNMHGIMPCSTKTTHCKVIIKSVCHILTFIQNITIMHFNETTFLIIVFSPNLIITMFAIILWVCYSLLLFYYGLTQLSLSYTSLSHQSMHWLLLSFRYLDLYWFLPI